MDYREFIRSKSQFGQSDGFDPNWMPEFLFDFQKSLVEWALRKGRAAIFADTGLGKSRMELAWAEAIRKHTGQPSRTVGVTACKASLPCRPRTTMATRRAKARPMLPPR